MWIASASRQPAFLARSVAVSLPVSARHARRGSSTPYTDSIVGLSVSASGIASSWLGLAHVAAVARHEGKSPPESRPSICTASVGLPFASNRSA